MRLLKNVSLNLKTNRCVSLFYFLLTAALAFEPAIAARMSGPAGSITKQSTPHDVRLLMKNLKEAWETSAGAEVLRNNKTASYLARLNNNFEVHRLVFSAISLPDGFETTLDAAIKSKQTSAIATQLKILIDNEKRSRQDILFLVNEIADETIAGVRIAVLAEKDLSRAYMILSPFDQLSAQVRAIGLMYFARSRDRTMAEAQNIAILVGSAKGLKFASTLYKLEKSPQQGLKSKSQSQRRLAKHAGSSALSTQGHETRRIMARRFARSVKDVPTQLSLIKSMLYWTHFDRNWEFGLKAVKENLDLYQENELRLHVLRLLKDLYDSDISRLQRRKVKTLFNEIAKQTLNPIALSKIPRIKIIRAMMLGQFVMAGFLSVIIVPKPPLMMSLVALGGIFLLTQLYWKNHILFYQDAFRILSIIILPVISISPVLYFLLYPLNKILYVASSVLIITVLFYAYEESLKKLIQRNLKTHRTYFWRQ